MLFTPYRMGDLTLPNRIVMPPMTRSRAGAANVPTALMADYHAQRASAGLIVSEGTQISQQGQLAHTPWAGFVLALLAQLPLLWLARRHRCHAGRAGCR